MSHRYRARAQKFSNYILPTSSVDESHKTATLLQKKECKSETDKIGRSNQCIHKDGRSVCSSTFRSHRKPSARRATRNFVYNPISGWGLLCRPPTHTMALTSGRNVTPARASGYCHNCRRGTRRRIHYGQRRTAGIGGKTNSGAARYVLISTED